MTMPGDDVNAQDAALLERLAAIAQIIDPVPDHVVELGRAAFGFRDADHELMQMVSRPVDAALVRSGSATSHLHFFEHGDVAIDVEVTVRGDFASVVGVVTDADATELEGLTVVLETADSSTSPEIVEGRFTVARVPVGLVRLVLRREGRQALSTGWFDVG
ncbi:MAG TPA: carboxypeptidase regulatory-like domain-containing protein [Humibacillus sp.]|nr:carboxypeptidase regulatory-like domain-containing protein [Humibacillus sp.]